MVSVRCLALALCVLGRAAGAQIPVGSSSPPAPASLGAPLVAPDSSAVFVAPNGALLRPGTFVYDLSLVRTALPPIPLGQRTVQVTDAAVAGVPGWLIAESRSGSAVPTSDSVWVTRADLSPERWVATVDHTQLGASFTHDSVYGAVQSYRGRSSFAIALPAGALLTGGMVDQVLAMLPLQSGYRASASLLMIEPGAPRSLPAELVVEREERVRVGSGDADCWVVLLRAGVMEERLWVTRDAPHVVRTQQVVASGLLTAELRP